MLVRQASANDSDAIADLAGQLGYPSTSPEIARRIAEFPGVIFVAEVDARVVAWITVQRIRSLTNDLECEIHGLVVDALYRNRGIGEALVRAAIGWARAQSARRLRVRTNDVRVDAHRFYERLGFDMSKRQRVYDLPLATE